ncbi:MAG: hypothetical protein II679_06795, partial [Ruminococcus sp.]|nr:hypothetical protein [Ruminococcus sp.]
MTYGQIRDAALKLLQQYSLGDAPIPRTYNEQGDDLRRIPELVDDAMWIIASGPRRIHAAKPLERLPERDRGGMMCCSLPQNLMEIVPGGLLVLEEGEPRYESGFVRCDEGHILLPRTNGEVWLEYYRRPRACVDAIAAGQTEPCDAYELDNVPDAHRAVPYYVAAQLAL